MIEKIFIKFKITKNYFNFEQLRLKTKKDIDKIKNLNF